MLAYCLVTRCIKATKKSMQDLYLSQQNVTQPFELLSSPFPYYLPSTALSSSRPGRANKYKSKTTSYGWAGGMQESPAAQPTSPCSNRATTPLSTYTKPPNTSHSSWLSPRPLAAPLCKDLPASATSTILPACMKVHTFLPGNG